VNLWEDEQSLVYVGIFCVASNRVFCKHVGEINRSQFPAQLISCQLASPLSNTMKLFTTSFSLVAHNWHDNACPSKALQSWEWKMRSKRERKKHRMNNCWILLSWSLSSFLPTLHLNFCFLFSYIYNFFFPQKTFLHSKKAILHVLLLSKVACPYYPYLNSGVGKPYFLLVLFHSCVSICFLSFVCFGAYESHCDGLLFYFFPKACLIFRVVQTFSKFDLEQA